MRSSALLWRFWFDLRQWFFRIVIHTAATNHFNVRVVVLILCENLLPVILYLWLLFLKQGWEFKTDCAWVDGLASLLPHSSEGTGSSGCMACERLSFASHMVLHRSTRKTDVASRTLTILSCLWQCDFSGVKLSTWSFDSDWWDLSIWCKSSLHKPHCMRVSFLHIAAILELRGQIREKLLLDAEIVLLSVVQSVRCGSTSVVQLFFF